MRGAFQVVHLNRVKGRSILLVDDVLTTGTTASECARVQPLSQMDPGHLPTVSFITPNECDDGHSCPLSTADGWLADHVPPLVQAGADVRRGRGRVERIRR